jgi:tetratricopeptide (TPR) repeat protein
VCYFILYSLIFLYLFNLKISINKKYKMSQNAVESTLFGGEAPTAQSPQGVLNEEAVELSLAGQHEAALEKYNKAIADTTDGDEKLPVFLANRAHSLVSLERLDEAIADCVRAQALDPKCITAYVAHSKAYAYRNKLG